MSLLVGCVMCKQSTIIFLCISCGLAHTPIAKNNLCQNYNMALLYSWCLTDVYLLAIQEDFSVDCSTQQNNLIMSTYNCFKEKENELNLCGYSRYMFQRGSFSTVATTSSGQVLTRIEFTEPTWMALIGSCQCQLDCAVCVSIYAM